MMSKFFSIILVGSFTLVAMFTVIGVIGTIPHRFIGEREFTTLEEMQAFQTEIVNEAINQEASVESFNLVIKSPPRVHYVVYTPKLEFKYGKPICGVFLATILQFSMGFTMAVVSTTIAIGIITDKII